MPCPSHFFVVVFWLCWVFTAAHKLSLAVERGDYSLLLCTGFSLHQLLLWNTVFRHAGFNSCSTQAQSLWLVEFRAWAQ